MFDFLSPVAGFLGGRSARKEARGVNKAQMEYDWDKTLWQNQWNRNTEEYQYQRGRNDARSDRATQFTELRDAAVAGGFNPLSVLGVSTPGSNYGGGGVGGAGGYSGSLVTPNSANGFQAVAELLSNFDTKADKRQELEIALLETELEQMQRGFKTGTSLMDPGSTAEASRVAGAKFMRQQTGDGRDSGTLTTTPSVTAYAPQPGQSGNRTVQDPTAVYDPVTGDPLELETEAWGAVERGEFWPWARDRWQRNNLSPDQYNTWRAQRDRVENQPTIPDYDQLEESALEYRANRWQRRRDRRKQEHAADRAKYLREREGFFYPDM